MIAFEPYITSPPTKLFKRAYRPKKGLYIHIYKLKQKKMEERFYDEFRDAETYQHHRIDQTHSSSCRPYLASDDKGLASQ